jgi:hypothetical protein
MTSVADGMLHLLAAEPSLLPVAPEGAWRLIEHRTKDEVHSCLRCGERAQAAYIAHTDAGNRWLDLCMACSHWLYSTQS